MFQAMSALIMLLSLMSVPVAADEPPPPWLEQPGEVVDGPIRPDMCIEAYWPQRSPDGYRFSVFLPPLDSETIRLAEQGRREGWVVLRLCKSSDA